MAHSLTKVAPYSCINDHDILEKSVLEIHVGLINDKGSCLRWARQDGLTSVFGKPGDRFPLRGIF